MMAISTFMSLFLVLLSLLPPTHAGSLCLGFEKFPHSISSLGLSHLPPCDTEQSHDCDPQKLQAVGDHFSANRITRVQRDTDNVKPIFKAIVFPPGHPCDTEAHDLIRQGKIDVDDHNGVDMVKFCDKLPLDIKVCGKEGRIVPFGLYAGREARESRSECRKGLEIGAVVSFSYCMQVQYVVTNSIFSDILSRISKAGEFATKCLQRYLHGRS
jgi:hypothetical protein